MIKGLDIKEISKKKAGSEKFLTALSEKEISGNVLSVYENRGTLYAWYRKKELVALYTVDVIPGYLPEVKPREEIDEEGKTHKIAGRKPVSALQVTRVYSAENDSDIVSKMDEETLDEIKTRAVFSDIEKVILFDGKILHSVKLKVSGISVSFFFFGLCMGLIYGIVFDDLCIGLLFGVSFGIAFSIFGIGKNNAWEELELTEENRLKVSEEIKSTSILE